MKEKVKELIEREENKLPLTFQYLEFFENKHANVVDKSWLDYLNCKLYQTDFLIRTRPFKKIVRML